MKLGRRPFRASPYRVNCDTHSTSRSPSGSFIRPSASGKIRSARVLSARRAAVSAVSVDGEVVGRLDEPGLVVLVGITHDDGPDEVAWLARKVRELRIMREERSASDVDAPILVVSQFTLYGDARKGRRPTWIAAAPGEVSEPLYLAFCLELERLGATVERGSFGADMQVALVNDGPVTVLLDTP